MRYFAVDDATRLSTLPDAQVEHIFTSPPYNVGRDYGPLINDHKSPAEYLTFAQHTAQSLARISTSQAVLGLVVSNTKTTNLCQLWRACCEAAGWTFGCEISLYKPEANLYVPKDGRARDHYRTLTEVLLCFTRDGHRPPWMSRIPAEGWQIPKVPSVTHPAPFSTLLVEQWLALTCPASNTLIYDPFSGSGTTVVVAQQQGYPALGTDLNPEYVFDAGRRLAFTQRPLQLPTLAIPGPTLTKEEYAQLPSLMTTKDLAPWFGTTRNNGNGFIAFVDRLPGLVYKKTRQYWHRDTVVPYLLHHGLIPRAPKVIPSIDRTEHYTLKDLLQIFGKTETGHRRTEFNLKCPGFVKIGPRAYWKIADAQPWIEARLHAKRRAPRRKQGPQDLLRSAA